jgi:hypothetical protein
MLMLLLIDHLLSLLPIPMAKGSFNLLFDLIIIAFRLVEFIS